MEKIHVNDWFLSIVLTIINYKYNKPLLMNRKIHIIIPV